MVLSLHTHPFNGPLPGLPRWAGTKPIWILLKQETMSGSGISWAICKSAPHSRQITMPAPTTQFFAGWMPFLPLNQQRQSAEGKWCWVYSELRSLSAFGNSTVALVWLLVCAQCCGVCCVWGLHSSHLLHAKWSTFESTDCSAVACVTTALLRCPRHGRDLPSLCLRLVCYLCVTLSSTLCSWVFRPSVYTFVCTSVCRSTLQSSVFWVLRLLLVIGRSIWLVEIELYL